MMLQFQATPLHFAAQNGHGSIVEYLITSGAKVNAVDNVSFLLVYLTHNIMLQFQAIPLYCAVLKMVMVQF